MNYRALRFLSRLALYTCVFIIIIIIGFPLYWMLATSLMPMSDVFDTPPHLIPVNLTIENYVKLFQRTEFPEFLKNSIINSLGCVTLTTVCATLAGYALRRYRIPGKRNLARLILFSYMFPEMLFAIPYFITFKSLGLLNSYIGVILAETGTTLPFGTWVMWMFFQTIPDRYEECAWMLGAGRIRSIFEIAMRLALPGAVATAIFSFAISWSDYTFPLILWSTIKNVPLGLQSFVEKAYVHWGLVEAGSTIAFLPPFFLVLFLQKYILEGFSFRGI